MSDFKVSVVLEKAISNYYRFLKRIYLNKQLHKEHVIANAIRRYETCWLPLLAKCGEDVTLVPPDDIWWIWQIHLLSIKQYQKDCLHVTGVEHQHHGLHLLSEGQLVGATNKTNEIWSIEYPKEPYEVNLDEINLEVVYKSRCKYDLRAAARRQRHFFYHVALPHYGSGPFLHESIERYLMFIKLKKLYPHQILIPMYDIDLIWHSHQLCTEAYQRDTINYLGQILHHDDTINSRTVTSVRNIAESRTKQLWYQHFRTPLTAPGTLYRGVPPDGTMSDFNQEMYDASATKGSVLKIDSIDMKSADKSSGTFECTISLVNDKGSEVDLIMDNTKLGKAFKVEKGHYLWDRDTEYRGKLPLFFKVALKQKYTLTLTVVKKGGLKGLIASKEFLKCRLDLEEDIMRNYEEMREKKTAERELNIKHESSTGITLIVQCCLSKFTKLDQEFCLEKVNSFNTMEMPPTLEDLWGPIPLHHISAQQIKKFPSVRVADYKIKGTKFIKASCDMSCRVIHSLPLRMSAIHVIQDSKMVAVSHLIGLDQLPKLETAAKDYSLERRPQSEYDYIALNTRRGQRAMIIKNNDGDWGVLLGSWVDRRKAAAKSKGKSKPASPGHLKLLFYDLTQQKLQCKTAIFYEKGGKNNTLEFAGMKLDVTDNGTITIRGRCTDVAENIALALSVISLFVLCEPRNKVTVNCLKPSGYRNELYKEVSGQKCEVSLYALGHAPWLVLLFVYFGYDEETPSNSHLYLAITERETDEGTDRTEETEEGDESRDTEAAHEDVNGKENQTKIDDMDVDEDDFYNPYCLSAHAEGEDLCPWDSSINGEDDDCDRDSDMVDEDEGCDGTSCATRGAEDEAD